MDATSSPGRASFGVPATDSPETLSPESRGVRRYPRLRRRLLTADVVAAVLTGTLSAVAAGLHGAALPVPGLALAAGWPLLAYACGLYVAGDLRAWASGIGEVPRLAVATLIVSWPLFGLLSILDAPRPALGAIAAAVLTGGAAATCRALARAGLHREPVLHERTVVLGSGDVAADLLRRIRDHREVGLEPVGFVDDDAHPSRELGVPFLGRVESLTELVASGGVDRVIIAFTRARHEQLLHAIRVCRDGGVRVDVVPRLFEFLDGARTIDQIGGMPLMSIQAPTFSRASRVWKRALDLVGATLALLVLAPLLLAIALAIRIDSRGPVLFTQRRSGRGGRFFTLYKFRSMRLDSEVLVQDGGSIVKFPGDDRVTRVGRFLRRFSLDEAPQLLNVLRGDMSLVGPRPLVEAEQDALSEEWQARRADLRPGLTGPWQVSGRSNIPFEDMIKLDYQYVAGWSLARDLEILLATLPAVIAGRGAY